jgi:poly(A)-specific ribonuclease
MDITKQTFSHHLPRILNEITECCFVALDLELSGIAKKKPRDSPVDSLLAGKQSLQARYEEIKAAAEIYQVLQIGLTFVREDVENGQRARQYTEWFRTEGK